MKNYIYTGIAAFVGALLAVVILGGLVGDQSVNLGGGTRFPNGISADSTSPSAGQVRGTTLTVTGLSTLASATFSSTLTLGSSGTAMSNYYCASASYNPPSLAANATSTTGFTLTGVVLGDIVTASFATSTQGITLVPYVSTNASTTVMFVNGTGGTIDLATSTLKVCFTH